MWKERNAQGRECRLFTYLANICWAFAGDQALVERPMRKACPHLEELRPAVERDMQHSSESMVGAVGDECTKGVTG